MTQEGLNQHSVQPQIPNITKLLDSNRHPEMPGAGLRSVGPEQTIPPG